jgi:coenzyme F420-reducing hydrogenase gamma subunit
VSEEGWPVGLLLGRRRPQGPAFCAASCPAALVKCDAPQLEWDRKAKVQVAVCFWDVRVPSIVLLMMHLVQTGKCVRRAGL